MFMAGPRMVDTPSAWHSVPMALPIFAYYMQKVYADSQLGYSQSEQFDLPEDFDPCPLGDDEFGPKDGDAVSVEESAE